MTFSTPVQRAAKVLPLALAALFSTSAAIARVLPELDAMRDARPIDAATSTTFAKSLAIAPATTSTHARLGVPTFVWGADAAALAKSTPSAAAKAATATSPEDTARAHLRKLAPLYRSSVDAIAALPLDQVQSLPNGGNIVRFGNRVNGVEVFRDQVNVLVNGQGALVAVGGFIAGAATVKSALDAPSANAVGAAQAVAVALTDYRFPSSTAARLQSAGDVASYSLFALPGDLRSDDGSTLAAPARVKRVWFRRGGELVDAHYVEVQVRDGGTAGDVDYYAYVVSAVDGALLYRHNQTADAAFTYRVYAEPTPPYLPYPSPSGRASFPHPTGTPDGVQPPFLPGNLVTLQNIPFGRNDPWLPAGSNRTIGNNVETFTNMLPPDNFGTPAVDECNLALPVNGDLHACTNGPATFDYVYDFNAQPNVNRSQVMAAVTNLFYINNYLHDWFYDAGFDEVSGNAQSNNYGRGGLGSDSLFAEAQDFSGTSNANMSTPSDGQRPRMRMFVWNTGTGLVRVVAPAVLSGVKPSGTAEFGPQAFDFTAELAVAEDAANPTGPTTLDGCTALTNAVAVAGKIAVIDRGICTFVEKARNAQAAGATGVLIVNNVAGQISMSGTDPTVMIPLASIATADGDAIRAQLATQPVAMRMARAGGVQREGSLDASLVAHEWGHYISNRLVNNSNGLVANQAGGLGEGFGDFHAMLLLVKEEDRNIPSNANFTGTYADTMYPLGGPDFAPDVYNQAYYYGTRRYPYSRDMTKNPLTLRHAADNTPLPDLPPRSPRGSSSLNSEVHNTGEVWASMLWECYSNLLNDTGRLTFTAAQERMKRYLVGGYKMMPSDPTFVTARDAILAVMLAQDPEDHALCLAGFAKRGLGVGAVAPEQLSQDNAGFVESFRATAGVPVTAVAIEYYHAAFDHYFVTHIADEITKLDNGTFVGWTRTGESFNVYADTQSGGVGVCRFFSTSFAPKSSHFYTPSTSECTTVKANPNWQFEATVFAIGTPDPNGTCVAATTPVYRLYNNGQGAAPNHRYTTSLATRAQMIARGWIAEGYGPLGVAMCAP